MPETVAQTPERFALKDMFAKRKKEIFEIGIGDVAKALGFESILFLIYMNPELGQRKSDSKGYTKEFWDGKFSLLDQLIQQKRPRSV